MNESKIHKIIKNIIFLKQKKTKTIQMSILRWKQHQNMNQQK